MTEALLQLQQQVQSCIFSDSKSFQTLKSLIHQITNEIQQHYTPGDDPIALYDILQRFQQAGQHLHVFKQIRLDTSGGEHYRRAFGNAKADTLYLFSLLQSAIHFGYVLPISAKQETF